MLDDEHSEADPEDTKDESRERDQHEIETTVRQESIVADGSSEIGPYRLLERVGEGGMGDVWRAEQTKPVHRVVALKVIKLGMDTKEVVARFEAERQALALMDHPCIAKVYDAGETPRGRPYIAMEYVRGRPINKYCDEHKLTTEQRLDILARVCDGVQHAHQKAIIHRDLKPGNILVTEIDGKPVPKIIDFGVAKATAQRLTEKTMFTAMGQMIGTPEYMSPEQARPTEEDIDTRTDVYSLGVILYELLVGALPFDPKALRRASYEEILRIIREQDPQRPSTRISTLGERSTQIATLRRTQPRRLSSDLRGDLDWITMKALEKDRARRYESPRDFATDIRRHVEHLPVLASPPSAAYRARKFVRRHRVGVSLAAASVTVLLAFAVTTMFQARRIAAQRDRAVANELLTLGQMHLEESPTTALAHALASLEQCDQDRGRELAVKAVARGPIHRRLPQLGPSNPLICDASRDGRWCAVGWGREGAVTLYSMIGGEHRSMRNGEAGTMVLDVSFSSDSIHVASSGTDSMVSIWRVADSELLASVSLPGLVELYPMEDPRHMIVNAARPHGPVRWFELTVPQGTLRDLGVSLGQGSGLGTYFSPAVDPRGRWIALENDSTIVLRPLEALEGGPTREVGSHEAAVREISVDPSGRRLASRDADGVLKIWDVEVDPPRLLRTSSHPPVGDLLGFDSAGRRLYTNGRGGTAQVWDLEAPPLTRPIELFDATTWVFSGVFLTDGSLVTCRNGLGVAQWDLPGPRPLIIDDESTIGDVAGFATDGSSLFVLSREERISWIPLSGAIAAQARIVEIDPEMRSANSPQLFYTLSPSRRTLAKSVVYAGEIWLADTETGKARRIQPFRVGVGPSCFSPSEERMVAVGRDNESEWNLKLIDLRSGEFEQLELSKSGGNVGEFQFVGEDSVYCGTPEALWLLDLRTRSVVSAWTGESRARWVIPESGSMLWTDQQSVLHWLNLRTQEAITLGKIPAAISQARVYASRAYHQGLGLVAISGAGSPDVFVFSLRTGERWRLRGHSNPFVMSLDFDPRGRWLVSVDNDQKLRLWPLPLQDDVSSLPYDDLREHLRGLTNIRVVADDEREEGYGLSFE